jgi:DedD protein
VTARRDNRKPSRPGRGIWRALLALGALAGVAFVVGAFTGVVWKEPGLLVAYLSGDTTEVAWSSQGPVASPSAVAKAEPETEKPKTVAAAPAPRPAPVAAAPPPRKPAAPPAAPRPKPPPVAAGAPHIAIQVGAFAERTSAELLMGELKKGGYPAYVAAGAGAGSPRWRVRVGPYRTREEADVVAARLKSGRSLPTWVLDEDVE